MRKKTGETHNDRSTPRISCRTRCAFVCARVYANTSAHNLEVRIKFPQTFARACTPLTRLERRLGAMRCDATRRDALCSEARRGVKRCKLYGARCKWHCSTSPSIRFFACVVPAPACCILLQPHACDTLDDAESVCDAAVFLNNAHTCSTLM